jgi:hypothetical protein
MPIADALKEIGRMFKGAPRTEILPFGNTLVSRPPVMTLEKYKTTLKVPETGPEQDLLKLAVNKNEDGQIFIPEGYKRVVVSVDGEETVSSDCGSCGAPAGVYQPECSYCETPRTHYEFEKKDDSGNKDKIRNKPSEGSRKLNGHSIVSKQEVQGTFDESRDVDLGEGAKVGSVTACSFRAENNCTVASVQSAEIKTGSDFKADECLGWNVDIGNNSTINTLTLAQGLESDVPNLRIGRNSEIKIIFADSKFDVQSFIKNLHQGVKIGLVVTGDFKLPKVVQNSMS